MAPTSEHEKGKIFVVVGASGTLAKIKIFPALWDIYQDGGFPKRCEVIAYARSKISVRDLQNRCKEYMTGIGTERGRMRAEEFWKCVKYVDGDYDNIDNCGNLTKALQAAESRLVNTDRVFYLALPPNLYKNFSTLVYNHWMALNGKTKLVLELHMAKDLPSFKDLQDHLLSMYKEDQLFAIDHHMSPDVFDSIVTLRFANTLLSHLLNRNNVSTVMLTHEDDMGLQNRKAGEFDEYGIIREIIVNHLFHMMCLFAMEKPDSCSIGHIKEAKLKLMKSVRSIDMQDVVVAQYVNTGAPGGLSYKTEKGVKPGSKTPTFANIIFYIDNERWQGVPFIVRCGKAHPHLKHEIRVQFKSVNCNMVKELFPGENVLGNELVFQHTPSEKTCLKVTLFHPDMYTRTENCEVDLSYGTKYSKSFGTDVFPRILHDLLRQTEEDHTYCLSTEELKLSWGLFTPVFEALHRKEPYEYEANSNGPEEADTLCKKVGYNFNYPQQVQ